MYLQSLYFLVGLFHQTRQWCESYCGWKVGQAEAEWSLWEDNRPGVWENMTKRELKHGNEIHYFWREKNWKILHFQRVETRFRERLSCFTSLAIEFLSKLTEKCCETHCCINRYSSDACGETVQWTENWTCAEVKYRLTIVSSVVIPALHSHCRTKKRVNYRVRNPNPDPDPDPWPWL